MKFQKIIGLFIIASIALTACKNTSTKIDVKKESAAVNTQKVTLAISGMTCEIGCAKTIQSKLSKKEGIASAKVVFKDSLALVEFDADKISKTEIIAFVEGIAGGDLYKATETTKKATACKADCKKECCANKDKEACTKKCDGKDKAACKKACDAKKASCSKDKKSCTEKCDGKDKDACKKACDAKKAECKKEDCTNKDKKSCTKKCDGKDKAACKKACDAKKA